MVHLLGVVIDDFARRAVAVAGGDAPGLLHAFCVNADDRRDFALERGDLHVAQLARPSTLADPFGGGPRLAVGGGDLDVAAKADGVVEAEIGQEREQLGVAEAAVGEDGHFDAVGQALLETVEAGVFEVVAGVLQFVLVDGEPDQRRGAAVAADEMQRKRCLVVGVEVGPVHRHHDLGARGDEVLHPGLEQIPDLDALIAEQPVDLLDRVFVGDAARLRHAVADHGHGERSVGHHAKRGVAQRQHTLGVQIPAEHAPDEFLNSFNPLD
jgi:hypothetical protein